MQLRKYIFIITIICFIYTIIPALPVNSQALTFGISPENPNIPYFELTLNPGESVSDTLIAKNFSGETLNLMVEPVDGKTATNGGISYDFLNKGGPSQWISTTINSKYEIRPYRIQRIPFTISVPLNTPPGEYVAGFLAALVPTEPTHDPNINESGNNFSVNVVTQIAVHVIIHVPGNEICKVEIKKMDATVFGGQWRFSMILNNSGNIHLKGKSNITIVDSTTQKTIDTREINLGFFVPKTDLLSENNFEIPAPGTYDYNIEFIDGKNSACHFTFNGTVVYGSQEQDLLATQSTILAQLAEPSSTPMPISTLFINTDAFDSATNSTYWYVWASLGVLLVAVGLVVYAVSILKRRK